MKFFNVLKTIFSLFTFIFILSISSFGADTGAVSNDTDLLGSGGGYFHPFLAIGEYYTDNYYNTKNDKKSELTTIFSPGIWLAYPGSRKQLMDVPTSPTYSGGMVYGRDNVEYFERLQSYFSYRADIEKNSNRPKEDSTSHTAEGFFNFNLKGGLSFDLLDKYVYTREERSFSTAGVSEKYGTNLLNLRANYDISEKLTFRLDYSNFNVNYTENRNDDLDRKDNSYSVYVFFKIRPKMSLFGQYQFTDVKYNKDVFYDGKINSGYVGVNWSSTSKTSGNFKVGYSVRKFESGSGINDLGALAVSGAIKHNLSSKTSISLNISRAQNESNIQGTNATIATNVDLNFKNQTTKKFGWSVDLVYGNNKYDGDITYNGDTKSRKDNYYGLGASASFRAMNWLQFTGSYIYTDRNSNFSELDYNNNTVFLSAMIFM